VLWPVPVKPAQSEGPAQALQDMDDASAVDTSTDAFTGAQGAALNTSSPPISALQSVADTPVEPSSQDDTQAAGSVHAGLHDSVAMLQIRMYAGDEQSATARWAMVAEAAELHVSRRGPAAFLAALMHAVLPGAEASIVALPIADEHAVGWLASNESFAALAAQGCRVILVGAAARRAAGMPTRLGEIGWLNASGVQVPAVALPAPNDLTASPTGKAEVWRALRALAAAGG
nr:hypothetical protein [Pseudomonas sp.]